MNPSTIYDAIVVGAGISGVMCAKKLHDSGQNILVVDKGRNFGGRMSTKKYSGAIFDHGAQFFTSKTEVFKNYCNKKRKRKEKRLKLFNYHMIFKSSV